MKKAAKKAARPAAKAPVTAAVKTSAPSISAAPVVALDSARVEALESKLAALASRVERLESARTATPAKRGLFGKKG